MLWCEETGAAVRDTHEDGAPYPAGRILEVRLADDDADDFADLWAPWIVGFGTR